MFILGILLTALVSSLITVAMFEAHKSHRTPSLTITKHAIDEIRRNTLWEIGELSERCISRVKEEVGELDTDFLNELFGGKK